MSYGIVLRVIGSILIVEALLMLPSLFISLYYGEGDSTAFIVSMILTLLAGLLLNIVKTKKTGVTPREG